MLSEFVLPYIFDCYKHPALIYNLMCIVGVGKDKRYKFTKKTSNISSRPITIDLVSSYFNISQVEAGQDVCNNTYSIDCLLQWAIELGWDNNQIKALKQEAK